MIRIINKEDCCGCSACVSICPKTAINFIQDSEGFNYPHVDVDKCVECGLCEKTCPIIQRKSIDKTVANPLQYKAVRIKDKKILSESSSGGAFSILADIIFDLNGCVCGVEYSEEGLPHHIIIDSKAELYKLRGSKYVQSNIFGIFPAIKQRLLKGQYVLFSGTSCQVDGLKKYLRKDYANLLTVDLVCHSIPSPLIYKEYLTYCSKKLKKEIVSIDMRYKKTYGWSHRFSYRYCFKDGKSVIDSPFVVNWGRLFFSEMINRPSCGDCQYANLNRVSDFTIADFWDDDKKRTDIYSKEGTSLLLVNTEKGINALESCQNNFYSWNITKEEALQPCLCHTTKPSDKRDEFWDFYYKNGFENSYNRYFADTKYVILKKIIKKIIKWDV